MGYTHGVSIDSEIRVCTKCNKELPNTNEYFCYANKKIGRLESVCKECKKVIGKEKRDAIRKKNANLDLFYEGNRHCIRCDRDLPNNKLYFPVDLACVDGLRNVCRECNEKFGNFLSPDFVPNEKWSEDDFELLKNVYHDYTNEELVEKFFPNRTKHALDTQADKHGFAWKTQETYERSKIQRGKKMSIIMKGRKMSEESKKKLSDAKREYYKTHTPWWKGKKRTPEQCKQISERNIQLGRWKGDNNPRHINPLNGSLNGNWQGGMTPFYQELRSDTKDWFNESMEFCDYNCVISGLNFDNIHHTTAFKDIVDETFKLVDIDKRSTVSDYTEEEFDNLTDVLKYLHSEYGYGACLTTEVHQLFHDTYGYKNFSPFDFLDFAYRIDIGEFDDWFEEKSIPININYEYIDYLESTLSSLGLSA